MKKIDLGKKNINKLLISFAIPCANDEVVYNFLI